MKKLYSIIAAVLLTATVLVPQQTSAQTPEKMSYQAVVRDANNDVVANQSVGMQISILQGSASGNAVYTETQAPTSNGNGLVTLEIGTGATTDDFSTIDWATGPYFIKTETDPTGGSNYTITGTSQLMSVPYALYAKTSGSSIPGPAGANGLDGINGTDGADGATGATGPQGPAGADGAVGATGPAGSQGPIGLTGPAGPQGAAGADGAVGATGSQGPAGADGAVGATGIQGATGADGVGIAQTISQIGNDITLSDGGGIVTITDTNTQLDEAAVDAFVGNNGYLSAEVDGSITNEIQVLSKPGPQPVVYLSNGGGSFIDAVNDADADPTNEIELPTGGVDGQVLKTDGSGNYNWVNQTTDTDTQLDVAGVTALGFTTGAHTTKYTDAEAVAAVGAHTVDTDTHLDAAGVTALGFTSGAHTTNTDSQQLNVSLTGDTLSIDGGNYVIIPGISIAQPIKIGDFRFGGIVFYIDGSGQHGLVCNVEDNRSSSGGAIWGCLGTLISGADATAMGLGLQNTVDITLGCAEPQAAANWITSQNINGYTDWFLPSKDELYELLLNRTQIELTSIANNGNAILGALLSSSEFDSDQAWYSYEVNGSVYSSKIPKYNSVGGRSVRIF